MRLWPTAAALSLLAFLCSLAYADTAAVDVNAVAGAVEVSWADAVVVICLAVAYCLRRFAPQGHLFHTDFGAWALSGVVASLSAVALAVQAHGLSKVVVVKAVMATIINAVNLSNPGVPAGTTAPMAVKKEAGSAQMIVLLALALSCALLAVACACNPKTAKVEGDTCAYQVLTAVDAVNGAAARETRKAVQQCDADGQALLKAGKTDESVVKFDKCHEIGDVGTRVVVGVEDGVQLAADGVEVGAKAGKKDFTGLVAPVVKAARDMVQALQNQGVKLQQMVTATLGGL